MKPTDMNSTVPAINRMLELYTQHPPGVSTSYMNGVGSTHSDMTYAGTDTKTLGRISKRDREK